MKGFMILVLTATAALAAPQYNYARPGLGGNVGYSLVGSGSVRSGTSSGFGGNYGSGVGSFGGNYGTSGSGFGGNYGASGSGFGGNYGLGSGLSGVSSGFGGSSGGFGGSSGGLGGSSAGFGGSASGFGGNFGSGGNFGYNQGQALVTKQFYVHSAPEEQDEVGADKVINLGPSHKNYRVIFIKAPYNNVQSGRVRFIAPADEEKTAIYVLSKKTDISDIQADVQQAHPEPTKPEVHFIKYKTNEEAAHAQRTIQAQYDTIQGESQVSDEGVAPLTSVVGSLGDSGSGSGGFIGGGHGGFGSGHIGHGGIGGGSGHVGHGGIGGGIGGGHGGLVGAGLGSGLGSGLSGSGSGINSVISSGSFDSAGSGLTGSYLPPSH